MKHIIFQVIFPQGWRKYAIHSRLSWSPSDPTPKPVVDGKNQPALGVYKPKDSLKWDDHAQIQGVRSQATDINIYVFCCYLQWNIFNGLISNIQWGLKAAPHMSHEKKPSYFPWNTG